MASHRPFRKRPNLHLALTQQTGSPRNPNPTPSISSRFSSPYSTPTAIPLATTNYSPSESAKFKAPSPYGVPGHFTPRQRHKYRRYGRAAWLNAKRISTMRTTWFFIVVFLTLLWWINGGSEEFDAVKSGAAGLGRGILHDGVMENMQFFPPSHPRIHVCTMSGGLE